MKWLIAIAAVTLIAVSSCTSHHNTAPPPAGASVSPLSGLAFSVDPVSPAVSRSVRLSAVGPDQPATVDILLPQNGDLAGAEKFLRGAGFTVSDLQLARLITATGTAQAVNRAFGVRLYNWHNPGTGEDFFANDAPPRLPFPVEGIVGLDNVGRPQPFTNHFDCLTVVVVTLYCHGLNAEAMRTAYGVQTLSAEGTKGDGQTVAIWAQSGFSQQYIDDFDQRNHLIAPKITTIRVVRGGSNATLSAGPGLPDASNDSGIEVLGDIETVHAMADHAAIDVYEMDPGMTYVDFLRAVAFFHEHIASISSGWCEADLGGQAAGVAAEIQAIAQDYQISVLASSGDTGRICPSTVLPYGNGIGVNYPASDPSVTAVGGTFLEVNSDDTRQSETAWDPSTPWLTHEPEASGGGPAPVPSSIKPALIRDPSSFPRPSWQNSPGMPPGTQRLVPDVAADAGRGLEIAVNPTANDGTEWLPFGGVSQSAPMWAGIIALADQAGQQQNKGPLGPLNPLLYEIAAADPTALFDVTTSDNGGRDLAGPAGPGWDYGTGLGTPAAVRLVADLVGDNTNLNAPVLQYTDPHLVDWPNVTVPPQACGTNGPVQLRNGSATAHSSRWPDFPQVTIAAAYLSGNVSYGDLDGVGHDDAALLVSCDTGGGTGGSTLADNLIVYSGAGGLHSLGVVTTLSPPVAAEPAARFNEIGTRLTLHRLTAIEDFAIPGDLSCCLSKYQTDVWTWNGNQFTPYSQSTLRR